MSNRIVDLIVGANLIVFTRWENILTASSSYLRQALQHINSIDHPYIILADEDPADVQIYLEFLHKGYVSLFSLDPILNSSSQTYRQIARAYLFGAIMQDVKYQNAVLEAFRLASYHYNDYPCVEAMNMIYDGTEVGSSARALLSDMMAYCVQNHPSLRAELSGLHTDALADVIVAMATGRAVCLQVPWTINCTHYYREEQLL